MVSSVLEVVMGESRRVSRLEPTFGGQLQRAGRSHAQPPPFGFG